MLEGEEPAQARAERQLVGHAHRAVQLDRLVRDLPGKAADPGARARDAAGARRLVAVHRQRGQQGGGAGLAAHHRHLGHPVAQRLQCRERPAELLAHGGVSDGRGETELHHPDRVGTGGSVGAIERRQQARPCVARSQPLGRRGGQSEIRGGAVHGFTRRHRQAVRAGTNDEDPEAVGRAGRHQKDICPGAALDQRLGAAHAPAIAIALRPARHRQRGIAARSLRMGEGRAAAPLGEGRQKGGPLRLSPEVRDHLAGEDGGRDPRLGDPRAPQLLGDDGDLHRACARAAEPLGDAEAQQAQFGQLGPGVVRRGRKPAAQGVAQKDLLACRDEAHQSRV